MDSFDWRGQLVCESDIGRIACRVLGVGAAVLCRMRYGMERHQTPKKKKKGCKIKLGAAENQSWQSRVGGEVLEEQDQTRERLIRCRSLTSVIGPSQQEPATLHVLRTEQYIGTQYLRRTKLSNSKAGTTYAGWQAEQASRPGCLDSRAGMAGEREWQSNKARTTW